MTRLRYALIAYAVEAVSLLAWPLVLIGMVALLNDEARKQWAR